MSFFGLLLNVVSEVPCSRFWSDKIIGSPDYSKVKKLIENASYALSPSYCKEQENKNARCTTGVKGCTFWAVSNMYLIQLLKVYTFLTRNL